MTIEEIPEGFESPARCHEVFTAPYQKGEDASPPLKTKNTTEEPMNEETLSLYKEAVTAKTEKMASKKALKEERIKVKTFKIDQNSFGIEWNISN